MKTHQREGVPKREVEKGNAHYVKDRRMPCILLQYTETANWRSRILCNRWLNMNEDVVLRK
jgi:hypothetical protein